MASLLAEYAVATHPPDRRRAHLASRAFLDTIAVALAGRDERSVHAARACANPARPGPGAASAREWLTGVRYPPAEAAFVNGVAAHALDLDDVSMAMWGHPSTVLVPVVVAVGEAAGASVGAVLDAYAVGLHVDLAVAAGFDLVDHYARGWHASVTVGTLGAVVAAARLLGLEAGRVRDALGLGVSMASGSRQNFGTATKALHIGLAAANAVRAAQLAGAGADASGDAVDGPLGFYALYGSGARPAEVVAALATPQTASLATLNAKRYPCCYQTHRAIDAALDVRARLGRGEIEEVVVHVNPGSDNSLIHPYATTPTQARFCMRYVVASALLRGRVDFASFGEDQVTAPDVQALMRRIHLRHDETPPVEPVDYARDYATVLVRDRAGTEPVGVTCTVPRGNAEQPLTDEELLDKVRSCLALTGASVPATELFDVLGNAAEPVTRVVDLLAAPGRPAGTGGSR